MITNSTFSTALLIVTLALPGLTQAALPDPGMQIEKGRTALVVTDPQNDFLSPKGVAWGVVGKSVAGWGLAIILVWVFNIVGTADLLNALRHVEAVPDLGSTWYIPTFFVPMLLVTHFMVFARLLGRR
ncbi:MAG: hypothetical protein WBN08_08385 [Thiogranum sp.]